jgi:glycosyltransferase involved in cell wall biosynthesis
MTEDHLPVEAIDAVQALGRADIVIGIPAYQNARTIAGVVRAAGAGLAKYFSQYTSVIIVSDAGSIDGTRQAVLGTQVDDARLLFLSHPLSAVHRLSVPYHGVPGKGSAFRLIFTLAAKLGARACAVVDSDLLSVRPERMDLLLRPVLYADFDFVGPYYHRHKYDGTLTSSVVYPLTRALYGLRLRQPVGGDFGFSNRLVNRFLDRSDWESTVARYAIDIWMTTIAVSEGFRVCQSFLGAALRDDAKRPSSDLSAMLEQVVGSVFALMEQYEPVWMHRTGSEDAELFGFRFDLGLEPVEVNVERMIANFRLACTQLSDLWCRILRPDTCSAVLALGKNATGGRLHLGDDLWVRVIYDFACAYHRRSLDRRHVLRSLTPLYLARVASFVLDCEDLLPAEVDARVEQLCRRYEETKPYLVAGWNGWHARRHDSPPRPAMDLKEAHHG